MIRFILAALLAFGVSAQARAADWLFPATSYVIPFSSSSTSGTDRIGLGIEAVTLTASTGAFIAMAYTPIAYTATSMFLPANVPVTLRAKTGILIAVISTSSGSLYVTEMTR